jgi:hypothetical protein
MWVLVSVLLVVALMIPITAILLDSPLGRSLARRLDTQGDGAGAGVRQLEQRIDGLEADLPDLNRAVAGMREELQFVQRLLEDPEKKKRGS